jgi:DNA-binding transcriptional LysR family regulator
MEQVRPHQLKSENTSSNPANRFARNTDWNLLKIFRQIAQCGSIGEAARRLNRQQPTITAALQRLEGHIGVKLCERTNKGIVLTKFGKYAHSVSNDIHESLVGISKAATSARRTESGPIVVKVISNLHLIPRLNSIFSEFHAKFPETEVKLDTSPWRSVLLAVTEGEIDIGIGFIGGEASPNCKLPVLDQTQQLYCGPTHALFGRKNVDISDLQHEPFVISADEPHENLHFRNQHRLGENIGGISDNLDERMWLIQLGLGIGFLPSPVVDASPFASKLWHLLPEAVAPVCPIYLMRSPQQMQNAGSKALWDIAKRYLQ